MIRSAGVIGIAALVAVGAVAGRAQAPRPAAAYRTTSPHWSHLRVQGTDYRISYLSAAAARNDEYAWAARHFDRVLLDFGDRGSVPVYRRLNPTAQIYRYVLNWTVIRPGELRADDRAASYYAHMREWYARHRQYRLEDAFLHHRGCGSGVPSEECRVTFKIWTTNRWVVNPGDAGLRAYQRERLASVASDVDGLFVDEQSSGDFRGKLDIGRTREYADWEAYERDMIALLRSVRDALRPGARMLLNTHTNVTPFDARMIQVAGGTHAEAFNNPFYPQMERRWRFAESVLAAGAWMDLPPGGDTPVRYTRGNSATPTGRRRLWELASYYLIAPAAPGPLAYNPGFKSKQPFAQQWVAAAEVDVGAPRGGRRVFAEGRDRSGRPYRVWAREYTGALVVVRPIIEWGEAGYGDESGVELRLPPGNAYRPLDADGRLGPPVTRLTLRASEAAILVTSDRAGRAPTGGA